MKQVAMVSSSPRMLRGKSVNQSRRSRSRVGLRSSLEGGGEPSSPKVTCIGQIRIRSNNNKNTESKSINLCQCLKRAFVCSKKKSHGFFFSRRKKKMEEKSSQTPTIAFVRETKRDFHESETESDDGKEDNYEEHNEVAASATAPMPPTNALLLMRCRSAPHNRSSPLSLSRFPISPASEREEEQEEMKSDCNVSLIIKDEEEKICSWSNLEVPTGLMRCMSEPAKRAEKMMEVSWCKISVSEERGMEMHLPSSSETTYVSS